MADFPLAKALRALQENDRRWLKGRQKMQLKRDAVKLSRKQYELDKFGHQGNAHLKLHSDSGPKIFALNQEKRNWFKWKFWFSWSGNKKKLRTRSSAVFLDDGKLADTQLK
ncbi:hypothetical protein DUI87_25312 [Hirundo rustica rustica]|uniref:Uncharacterized protein n=1 Tax=Hirundo rustica rustica TaxID=333673 RepID=A0A3M0JU22_HIRRU|nr:hypothetical protein DUI87_25312 [Hirundo rustica rustica]